MKLGILNACTPADEVEFELKEFESFRHFFALTSHTLYLHEYRITEGDFPQSTDACDAYLITGSPRGAYEQEPWIAQLSRFIVDVYAARQRMVGVCFGHQILAHALGGRAEKSTKGWGMGLRTVGIVDERAWMQPALSHGAFHFCHQDQVVQLPAAADRLAGNDFCPNGMFVIGDRVLGLQAHPEFTTSVMAKAIELLAPDAGAVTAHAAAASLHGRAADNRVMAQWIRNFLMA